MLRRTPSLALRAVLTFTAVYIAAIAVFLAVMIATDDPNRDRHGHTGPKIALSRAAEDLARMENGFRLPRDGGFAAMAARNPQIWLIGRSGDATLSFGRVPQPVARAFEQHALLIESARFYVPGVERPLANAVVERRRTGTGSILLAAGGVDPETLGSGDSLGASWGEGVVVILFWIAIVGFAAMLIALPILSRALRPLAAEAASILPQEPARRLDEEKAPRELLPLVRGFNAALDRLASELGRRKRFIADAAHELRTPLAVVALRVEALADETDKQELRRGLGRLVHLVSQMLDIERLSLVRPGALDRRPCRNRPRRRRRPCTDRDQIGLRLVAGGAGRTGPRIGRSPCDLPRRHQPHRQFDGAWRRFRADPGLSRRGSDDRRGGRGPRSAGGSAAPPVRALFPRELERRGCGLGLHLTREILRAHGGEVRLVPGRGGATFRLSFASPDDESRA
jgi:signal transduction histidine kinase